MYRAGRHDVSGFGTDLRSRRLDALDRQRLPRALPGARESARRRDRRRTTIRSGRFAGACGPTRGACWPPGPGGGERYPGIVAPHRSRCAWPPIPFQSTGELEAHSRRRMPEAGGRRRRVHMPHTVTAPSSVRFSRRNTLFSHRRLSVRSKMTRCPDSAAPLHGARRRASRPGSSKLFQTCPERQPTPPGVRAGRIRSRIRAENRLPPAPGPSPDAARISDPSHSPGPPPACTSPLHSCVFGIGRTAPGGEAVERTEDSAGERSPAVSRPRSIGANVSPCRSRGHDRQAATCATGSFAQHWQRHWPRRHSEAAR